MLRVAIVGAAAYHGCVRWPWAQRDGAVPVITDAPESPADEQRRRQRTYTAIMVVHIVGFALSGVLYYTAWWLGLVVLIVTTPLPWIAVVIANDRGRRRRGRDVTPPG
jgi:fatty acid desaturase